MKIEMKSLRIILIIVSITFGPFCGCEKDEDPPKFKEQRLKEVHENGRLLNRYYYENDNPIPIRSVVYDENGMELSIQHNTIEEGRIVSTYIYDADENLTGIREFYYNDLGLVSELWVNRSQNDFTPYLTNSFEYDQSGRLTRQNVFDRNGTLSFYLLREYPENNTIKRSYFGRDANFGGVVYEEYEDSYNPYHRLRTLTSQEWSKNIKRTYSPHPDENGKVRLDLGNTYITIFIISYSYSYNDHKYPIERITISGDPSVANVTHTFIYHE